MNKLRNTPLQFKAQATDTLCLDIYDTIGADFFGDGITAGMVSEAIKSNPGLDITLNINSPGGDLFEGVAIYNVLKASGKAVTVNVVGLAASAASLIAMADDTVTMQLGTQLMIHNAMAMSMGFADDMRKMADTLDSVSASAADIYVAKTGMSKEKVLNLMTAESWMSPEEAVKDKFATSTGKGKAERNCCR
jgi:ATP-dependent protease ClpP protease subunit